MITTCTSKRQPVEPAIRDLNLEEFEGAIEAWKGRLHGGLKQSIGVKDEILGHFDERVLQETRELQRQVGKKAAQAKVAGVPPICPYCGVKLSRVSAGHARTFESCFGPLTIQRAGGCCRKCRKWRLPADALLGLEDKGRCSSGAQEMAAQASASSQRPKPML